MRQTINNLIEDNSLEQALLNPHHDVLSDILASLSFNDGIVKIIGKSGSNKAGFCQQLKLELENNGFKTLYFGIPPSSPVAMTHLIRVCLRLDRNTNFTKALTQYLTARADDEKRLVIIFEKAEKIDHATFHCIRMLNSIQSNSQALISVVLSGSPKLNKLLALPSLRALSQSITQNFELTTQDDRDEEITVLEDFQHTLGSYLKSAWKNISRDSVEVEDVFSDDFKERFDESDIPLLSNKESPMLERNEKPASEERVKKKASHPLLQNENWQYDNKGISVNSKKESSNSPPSTYSPEWRDNEGWQQPNETSLNISFGHQKKGNNKDNKVDINCWINHEKKADIDSDPRNNLH